MQNANHYSALRSEPAGSFQTPWHRPYIRSRGLAPTNRHRGLKGRPGVYPYEGLINSKTGVNVERLKS